MPAKRTNLNVAALKTNDDDDEVVCELDLSKPAKLSAKERDELNRLRAMPDSEIDYSDIPKHTGNLLDPRLLVHPHYKPKKVALSVRLDEDIVHWLKSGGKGYQTRLNRILRGAMLEAVLPTGN